MALSDYPSVRTGLFVKVEVPRLYSNNFFPGTLTFTDNSHRFTYDGDEYVPLGRLLSISSTTSELRSSANNVTITISGIPNSSIKDIMESEFRTSPVRIWRGFFLPSGEFIDDGSIDPNPVGKFKGFINNVSIFESWDTESRTSTNTIQFECQSFINILAKKKGGRQTNPVSMKRYYPLDISFDRVPKLAGRNFDFGGS